MENHIIVNYDDYERCLHQIYYNELRIAPEEHKILFLEHEWPIFSQKEKICQIAFETFNVLGLQCMLKTIASLYSSGRITGAVLQIGAGATSVTPIWEGYRIANGSSCHALGGENITHNLAKLLTERGLSTISNTELYHIINSIKHDNCYVSQDYDNELSTNPCTNDYKKDYVLPDGQIIETNSERFRAPEVLFNPKLINREDKGISHIVFDAIAKCDLDLRLDLYKNVIMSGATCRLKGIKERLMKDLSTLISNRIKLDIVNPPEAAYSSWIGGSIQGSIDSNKDKFITKNDYDEVGPLIALKRCAYLR